MRDNDSDPGASGTAGAHGGTPLLSVAPEFSSLMEVDMESKSARKEGAASLPDVPWLRDGLFVYALARVGWKKGEPVMANRIGISISGGFVGEGQRTPPEELDAVASLVHAAPELLEAAKAVLAYEDDALPECMEPPEKCGCVFCMTRLAIAKAEGR